MNIGLIIGIIIALAVIGVIIYNNVWRYRAKHKKRIGSKEYIDENNGK